MLVFIPAITMSIWAEERRQGTDELLLTLPASDFDVVLGKYLAGVAILHRLAVVLDVLDLPGVQLRPRRRPTPACSSARTSATGSSAWRCSSIGMVASFLTSNLTVGFILGMIFNLPLAMFGVADWFIKNPALAQSDQALERASSSSATSSAA